MQIDHQPFSEGMTREAYKMLDLSRPPGKRGCVVKQRKKGATLQHWVDVILQEMARALAQAYNSMDPPKRVQYIPLYLIRYRGLDLTVEPFVKGKFLKYNNNRGFVPPYPRSTPQAFTHFTYHYSKGSLMVVDVQGVKDYYTDPQIHTVSLHCTPTPSSGRLQPRRDRHCTGTHRCCGIRWHDNAQVV